VTSCDLNGVTTSYVFDGATNVTAIQVDGIADNCDGAIVSVAASHSYTDTTSSSDGPMASGSAGLTTYVNGYNDFDFENNSIIVPLDTPVSAELFNTVTVTLHGGQAPVLLPG
jgi:hypothetical protein